MTVTVAKSAEKVFVDDLAQVAAVEGVGEIDAEVFRQVAVHAAPDLFVGGEGDAEGGPRQVGVFQEMPCRGHDHGDARLVIGAQQRGARGGHDVMADLFGEIGKLLGRERQVGVVGECDRAAVVAANDAGFDAGRVELRRGVDMGEKADGGAGGVAGGWWR